MKNNKFIWLVVTGLILSAIFTACNDDENYLGSLQVTVLLKEGLKNISIENIPVLVTNTTDNTQHSLITDINGAVFVDGLAAGTYNITISAKNEEGNYYLSGTQNNVVINTEHETTVVIELKATIPGTGLVIKELYYNGAADNYVSLFKDQFVELVNNSDETIYADGLFFANLHGETGGYSEEHPITEYLSNAEYVYADWIEQVPGTGNEYPIEPGKSFVIALNAINFKEGNPVPEKAVDNTGSDLERYSVKWLENKGLSGNEYFDLDNPMVPNMRNIFILDGLDHCLLELNGPGVVIFRRDEDFSDSDIITYTKKDEEETEVKIMKIPVADIIDGVDCLENSGAVNFKRIPENIDAGFISLSNDGQLFYSSKSIRRKVDEELTNMLGRLVLMDTNNSTVDFEAINLPDQRGYDNYIK